MWGYSFEDLARRAQEEAARLAEQASSSTGFLNLDSMNPDDTSPSNNDGKNNYANPDKDTSADEKPHGSVGATHGFFGFSTPQNTASSFFHGHPSAQDKSAPHVVPPATTEAKLRESESKPTAAATEIATASATKVHTTPIVTKLPSAAESDDFDPNSWGEDDDNIFDDPDNEDIINTNMDKNVTKISNDDEHLQLAMGGMTTITEDSDEMAERMREESRKLAEQIMLEEEEQRMKMKEQQQQQQLQDQQRQQNEGSQHPEAQADNGYREQHSQLKQHQQDHQKYHQQQRIDPSDLEAEQLREQSRLAAEAIMKADLVAEGRPCEDSGRERREGKDETAVREAEGELAEEATFAEQARIAEEEVAAEAERQRLEEKRLAEEARFAEEEAAAEAERQRLEEERLAEEARLAEEEAAAEAERQRFEEERLVEEARLAEEEVAAEAERQRLEEERLAEEARLAEEEAAAEAERQRLEEERLAEEARLVEEEAAAEAERQRLEEERLAEDARLAEEEAAAEAGRQRLEEERLAEEARLAEEDAAAEADCLAEDARLAEERAAAEAERQRLEEERLAEEARLAEEEAVVEAERQRLEEERFSKKSSYADNAECQRLEVEQFANEGKITVNDASAETDHQNLEEEKLPNLSQQHPFSQNDFFIQASCEKTCSGENVVENGREDDSNADVNVDDFDGMRPDVGESDCNTMLSIKVVKQKRSDSQFVGNLRNETEDTSESEKTGPAISTVELCTAERMDHTEDAITRLTLHESESEKFEGLSVEETESIRYTSRGTVTEFEGDSLKQNDVLNEEENELELRGSSDESLSQKNDAQQRTETNVDQQNTQSSTTPSLQSLFGSHATQLLEASNAATNMFSWGFNTHNVAKTVKGANNEGSPPNKDDTAPVSMMKNSNDGIVNESDEMCISGDFDDLYNDNELDDMYDDDEETDEEIEKNIQSSDTKETTSEKSCSLEADDIPKGQDSSGNIPQAVLDNFMKQLERLNESHQLEMNELLRSHKIEVERLENELSKEREFKNKAKARAEVASQDKYLGQMRELEKKFNATLKEKEDELEEVIKRNEGMTLKMDSMKREVEGLAKIVDERDDEICRLKQGHGTTMMQVEGKVKVSQEELARKDAEIMELKSSMSAMKADLDSTSESYDTLKARAKTIATELKDRRVEVRTLTSQNEELRSLKVSLETQVTNLRALVNQHELTISYKDKDMEVLYEKMKEMTKQLEGKDKSLQDRSAVGEKAIASYKRKAQEALAAANARLASANQAREEAESDAKSAKLAADDAVERARMAEARRTEAEKSRNELASQLEEERSTRTKEIAELKDSVEKLNETIALMEVEANETHAAREILIKEIDNLETKLSEEREKSSDLREKLIEEKTLCDSLQREVHDLHDEVQRSSAAAFKRAQNKAESTPLEKGADNNSGQNLSVEAMNSTDRSEADGTIIMLQQELQGANDAIMELKLALRTALLEKTEKESIFSSDNGDSVSVFQNEDNLVQSHNNDNTPLFFAIEKQNELNTAREEINRLASMLGDAESEKQEAFDAMEQMRQKMEEANARLLRYEKLGMQTARSQHTNTTSSSYGPFRSIGSGSSYSTAPRGSVVDSRPQLTSGHDSVVNLEYLKNVMLSYLKAKTLAEKRKLVPVIGTVLCLTPEEQAQAVDSVEQSAGLGGVASSFWENLESKAHNFM